jgi:hypothetical protein
MSTTGRHHPLYVAQTRVFVSSSRYGTRDISAITIEVNMYENIGLPYITGRLIIIDSANASNAVHFQGQERVTIIVLDSEANPIMNKEFICVGIDFSQKVGDDKSGFSVKLIEEHVLLSNSTRFSKVYEGKPDAICNQICSEQLGVSVTPEGSPTQSDMRVVFPFTTSPLEAANWMAARCTNANGIPFYFYSTMDDNNLQLKDISNLLGQGAFNADDPYIFGTTSNKGAGQEEDWDILSKKITNYTINNNEDTLLAMARNVFGGYYNFIDTYEYGGEEIKYQLTDPLETLPKPNGSTTYNYDPAFTTGRPYHEGQNTYTSQVVTRKLFDDKFSFLEEDSVDKHLNKSKSRAIYAFMDQQPINVTVPGISFGFDKLGQQMDVYIQKDIPPEEKSNIESVRDKKRSGTYLVQKVMYTIFNNRLTATVTATKTSTDPSLGAEQLNQN